MANNLDDEYYLDEQAELLAKSFLVGIVAATSFFTKGLYQDYTIDSVVYSGTIHDIFNYSANIWGWTTMLAYNGLNSINHYFHNKNKNNPNV